MILLHFPSKNLQRVHLWIIYPKRLWNFKIIQTSNILEVEFRYHQLHPFFIFIFAQAMSKKKLYWHYPSRVKTLSQNLNCLLGQDWGSFTKMGWFFVFPGPLWWLDFLWSWGRGQRRLWALKCQPHEQVRRVLGQHVDTWPPCAALGQFLGWPVGNIGQRQATVWPFNWWPVYFCGFVWVKG